MKAALLIAAVALTAGATAAHAYPQFQMSREQTCGSCHLSPDGGGLINDNGELTAEDDGFFGKDPRFLYGAIETPAWLRLGGDIRLAGGTTDAGGGLKGSLFPMQAELHVAATKGAFTVMADLGFTPPQHEGSGLTALMSREHYLLWMQHETGEGWYARAGRYQPVYGLRLAEHPAYVRRFGGTPLFSETYGASIGWTSPELEFHLSGYAHDRLRPNVADGDGASIYAEKRFAGTKSLGVQARYAKSPDTARVAGGVTGKLWLPGPEILFSAEVGGIRETFDDGYTPRVAAVGNVMATWFPMRSVFVDLGVGHYDQDTATPKLDRDAVEANLHWFADSHFELVLMGRLQLLQLGDGGPNSGYALLQLHYRL